ncbi:phage tail tape measure protein [Zoogloea sp. LCSB751]|uniref:phage tail tape measure protein n=1 Tax=Zoogloea sp. LCSB751 TaxID=1965277 RepID=UPI0009A55380|nr:phage tail tape measure protein [Zoogloea sp. LCSB751]
MDTLRLKVILESLDNATKPLQGILKGTSALGKAAKETRDRLRDLNAQNKQLESFRTTTARVTETAQALQAARDRVRDLGSAIAAAERPSKALTDEYKAATRELRTLTTVHDRAAQAQRTATADMERAKIPINELANRQAHLAKQIASATGQLERQGAQLSRIRDIQRNWKATQEMRGQLLGAGTGAVGTGTATGLPLLKSVKDFADLQTATTDLKIAMMESGKRVPEEFDKIAAKARELGARLPGTSQDFMLAGKALVEQGVNFKSIVDGGLEATSYLAVLLKLEKDRAAEFIAKAREVHGLQDRDLPAGADLMQRARIGFGLKPDQIYEAMSYSGTDINIKGLVGDLQKMKEYLALQGMAAGVGLEGSSFGTNFGHMLKAMANVNKLDDARGSEGKYVRDLLASKNIKFDFFDAAGQFAGFGKMVQELEKLKQFNPQQQERILKKLFDTEGGRPAAIFLKGGMQGFQDAIEKMDKQENLTNRVNEALGTLQNRWDTLGGTFNEFSTKVGTLLEPAAQKIMDLAGRMVGGLTKFIDEYPGLSKVLVVGTALFAGLAGAVGTLALAAWAISGPLGILKTGFEILGVGKYLPDLAALGKTALPFVKDALLAIANIARGHPVLLLITTLAGAAALIWKNWDAIGPKLSEWWDRLSNFISEKIRFILDKFAAIKRAFSFDFSQTGASAPVGTKALVGAGANLVAPSQPLRPALSQPFNYSAPTTFNITAPQGQSPEEIARAVDRRLDQRDRQAQAMRRSIFADTQ